MTDISLSETRVLVIDDDEQILEQVKSILERLGVEHVHLVSHADEGIDAFRNSNSDVVLLDLCLDEQSGVDLVMKLADIQPGAKCIIMSAAAEQIIESIEVLARKCGIKIVGRLRKPLSEEKVQAVFAKLEDAE